MAITEQTPYTEHVGNGSTVEFAYTFKVFADTDPVVYVDEELKVLNIDYTISGVGEATGGSITFDIAPSSGKIVRFVREIPYDREVDYQTSGDLLADTLDDDLDRIECQVQQLDYIASRALTFPIYESAGDAILPPAAERATTVLAFDGDGLPIAGPKVAAVDYVFEQIAKINTIADNIEDIDEVSDNMASVNYVGSHISDIQIVANDLAGQAYNYDLGSITEAADGPSNPDGDITVLAENIEIIQEVADNIDEITAIGSSIDNINIVGLNITDVNTCADGIEAIVAAPDYATAASTSAGLAEGFASDAEAARDVILGMTAVTGDAGTEVIWDAETGTLTVPRGDTGATGATGATGEQGIQGIQGIQGEKGDKGDKGDTGIGVITGGTTNQVLAKNSGTDYDTKWLSIVNLTGDETIAGVKTFTDGIITADLQFSGGTGTQGTMSWNADEETVDLIQNGATLQLGQELHVHCRNNTASTIANGKVVMATGTLGASGRILIAPYNGTTDITYVVGIATEDIAAGEDGKITAFGKVRGVDTSAYNQGDVLYPATSGNLTATAPTSGVKNAIAMVINQHATQGTLMVRFTPFDENAYVPISGDFTLDLGGLT